MDQIFDNWNWTSYYKCLRSKNCHHTLKIFRTKFLFLDKSGAAEELYACRVSSNLSMIFANVFHLHVVFGGQDLYIHKYGDPPAIMAARKVWFFRNEKK